MTDTIDDQMLEKLLASGNGAAITPEHRSWMNKQIKATLAKKERGEMNYTLLDEVRREFGLDAS